MQKHLWITIILFLGLACSNEPTITAPGVAAVETENTVPIPELGTDTYAGEQGGLYYGGGNEMSTLFRRRYERRMRQIQPLGFDGLPDSTDGVILFASMSMSNGTQLWCNPPGTQNCREGSFIDRAMQEDLNPYLRIINCSKAGKPINKWVRSHDTYPDEIMRCIKILNGLGYSAEQLQLVWTITAQSGESQHPLMPDPDSDMLETVGVLSELSSSLRTHFPNLMAVYLQSRVFSTAQLGDPHGQTSPHPWEYETAFATRRVVNDRVAAGRPALFWGPYFYSNEWPHEYLQEDGLHPSYPEGVMASTKFMVTWFKAECWFLASSDCP